MDDERNAPPSGTHPGVGPESSIVSLPLPVAIVARSGLVGTTNAAWSAGRASIPVLVPPGHNLLDALSRLPDGSAAAEGIRQLFSGERASFSSELWLGQEGGDWISLFASRDVNQSCVVVIDHITERSLASGVARGECLYRIIESAMDGIITINEQGRVLMFNASAERMFGVSAGEAIGGPLDRLLPVGSRPHHADFVRRYGRTGVSSRTMGNMGTVTGLRADGTEFPIEASISHVHVGAERYYSAILRDVSERKHLEAQLLQSQKLEGVGRLAGGVAHDFNNLIMAMFNYLALATRRLGPDHEVTPILNQTRGAVQRAADLTRQLLLFARQKAVNPRLINPREIISDLAPLLHRLIGEDIALRTILADDTGNVFADGAQIEQVLVNLAVNARDAMPRGGTLTIEARNELLDDGYCRSRPDAKPGEHVVISVTDTGAGITPEVMRHIFEPFFTTKPASKGTGLGLATCHGIIKQSGGHIAVYSEPGLGTAMRIFLPRVREEAAPPVEPSAADEAPGGTETILIAEDDDMVRELLAEELRHAGYHVLVAGSGPEALRVADAYIGPIHLLLSDVVMPEFSGHQLAERLAERRRLSVIYMSGYTEETIAPYGVDAKQVPFIAKPCMTDALLRLIHRVLRHTWTP